MNNHAQIWNAIINSLGYWCLLWYYYLNAITNFVSMQTGRVTISKHATHDQQHLVTCVFSSSCLCVFIYNLWHKIVLELENGTYSFTCIKYLYQIPNYFITYQTSCSICKYYFIWPCTLYDDMIGIFSKSSTNNLFIKDPRGVTDTQKPPQDTALTVMRVASQNGNDQNGHMPNRQQHLPKRQ